MGKTSFANKNVAILGLGIEGFSSAQFLAKQKARVTIFDEKEAVPEEMFTKLTDLGCNFVLGKDAFGQIGRFDLAVRTPGLKIDSEAVKRAERNGAKITSQTKLFFDLCPCSIIGVTGTKGKGTTSTLIYEMLKTSGRDVYLGGNIGTPPLDFLDKLSEQSVVVLELSSFQLQDLDKSPHIAVMLMIVPEHLNYHKDMAEYVDAKRNIVRFQTRSDFAVVNRDYPPSHESDVYTEGQVFQVTREREATEQGTFIKDSAIWMKMQGTEWKIINFDQIALPGKHNIENAAAAAMAATLAGAAKSDIVSVLRSFHGLEHRLQLVREVDGVKYYDDSFSTTPETAIAAIEAFQSPEILILGGSSKKSDFTELGEVIAKAENVKAIIGIGVEWERIKEAIDAAYSSSKVTSSRDARTIKPLLIEGAKDIATIVQAAAKIAAPGDVVLLSPACASFDMFENYKQRGNLFKEAVRKL